MIQYETFPTGRLQCNCTVIHDDQTREAWVIDPGDDPDRLIHYVRDRDLSVKRLLHTHAHFDHIDGSALLREAWGAELCLHQDDLELYQNLKIQGQMFGLPVRESGPVDAFIEDEQEYTFTGESRFLKAIHTPGHTPGSCSFTMEFSGQVLLWSGDTLFRSSVGRTDLPGGDTGQLLRSIRERLLHLPPETLVIPGHGGNTTIDREKRSNPYL